MELSRLLMCSFSCHESIRQRRRISFWNSSIWSREESHWRLWVVKSLLPLLLRVLPTESRSVLLPSIYQTLPRLSRTLQSDFNWLDAGTKKKKFWECFKRSLKLDLLSRKRSEIERFIDQILWIDATFAFAPSWIYVLLIKVWFWEECCKKCRKWVTLCERRR